MEHAIKKSIFSLIKHYLILSLNVWNKNTLVKACLGF